MDLNQAIQRATTVGLPGLFSDESTKNADREDNEEAIKVLITAWREAPAGQEPFPFDIIRELADRNRALCDELGTEALRDVPSSGNLSRSLSDDDRINSVAVMQHRPPEEVRRSAGAKLQSLGNAFVEAPVWGMVCGIDLETTDRYPDRGYIVNVGLQFMQLTPTAKPDTGYTAFCGIPPMYKERGIPLSEIHKITWADLDGKKPFRTNAKLQKAILTALETYPFMAHNAAFEDSWLALHLNGYAEARKAGRIVPIDTRDICRSLDPEYSALPHDSRPGALENWALRRGTLKPGETERHLGLEDVDLMFRTVQAEFKARNVFGA